MRDANFLSLLQPHHKKISCQYHFSFEVKLTHYMYEDQKSLVHKMEEENTEIWDIVVKRWQETKQEYADAVTELVLTQTRLTDFLLDLQTKFSDIQLDGTGDHGVDIIREQPRIYQTRLHHLLYGDSIQPKLERDREITRREELQHRGRISALKIRMRCMIETVEQFFKHELRSNEVFILLDRAHCLELQMNIMLQTMEEIHSNSNVL